MSPQSNLVQEPLKRPIALDPAASNSLFILFVTSPLFPSRNILCESTMKTDDILSNFRHKKTYALTNIQMYSVQEKIKQYICFWYASFRNQLNSWIFHASIHSRVWISKCKCLKISKVKILRNIDSNLKGESCAHLTEIVIMLMLYVHKWELLYKMWLSSQTVKQFKKNFCFFSCDNYDHGITVHVQEEQLAFPLNYNVNIFKFS